LVKVSTEDGLYGLGETYAGTFAPEVVRAVVQFYRPYLVRQDASDIAGLWRRCHSSMLYWGRSGIAVASLSAVEAALWDVCGKAAGKPAYELLGGPAHRALPRYASGGMEADPSRLREEQVGYCAAGYRATKIRTGVNPEADYEKATLARQAIGATLGLACDAVQGSNPRPWPASRAIEAGRRLAPLDLLWYEEPCAATDVEGYVRCRRELDMPIAGGESCTTLHEARHFLDAEALDIIQPDASWIGGLLEMRKVGAYAEACGVEVAVHAWGSGGTVMSNYHVGFAMPNCRWLEYPTLPNPLITELLVEPLEIRDGLVQPPSAPGLGLAISSEMAAHYPYRPDHHYWFEERR
jgi:L-alanine-DL-glutamate epimerase-like enolase superfamily enzyme